MSDTISSLIEQANVALQNNDFELADARFNQVLEEKAEQVDALFGLGSLRIQQGEFEAANKYLSLAGQLEPNAADIALNNGYALAKLGQRNASLKELQRATKFCGNDFVLCGAIAEIFVSLNEADGALQVLERLEALTPQDQIIMARAYGLKHQWSEAVRVLYRLSEDLPEDATVLSELATAAATMRDYRIAIEAFEKLLKVINPSSWDYVKFADLLLLAQQTERSQQAIKLAEDAGETSPDLLIIKAKLQRLDADYTGAQTSIQKVIGLMPLNGQAWYMRAELADDSELDAGLAELEEAMQDESAFLALPYHQQSLLFFASAKYADRIGNYEIAAHSLREANNIRMEEQKRTRSVYDSELAEERVERIKNNFNLTVAEKRGAKSDKTINLRPIFIVGMPRSGTTLVEKILSRHKDVQALGEQESMMSIASDYWFYQSAGQMPKPEGLEVDQWQAMRQAYLDKIVDLSKPVFTDKLPSNYENVGLILKLFPEARIVQLHRDPKDTALSVYENPFPLGHQYASWLMDTIHATEMAEKLMSHWTGFHSPQILDVNYEDLVNNPEYISEKILSFCELEWSQDVLKPKEGDALAFTFSELQARRPITSNRIGRWQNYANYFPEFE